MREGAGAKIFVVFSYFAKQLQSPTVMIQTIYKVSVSSLQATAFILFSFVLLFCFCFVFVSLLLSLVCFCFVCNTTADPKRRLLCPVSLIFATFENSVHFIISVQLILVNNPCALFFFQYFPG